MERGYPPQAGRPVRPANQTPVYAGATCWIEMTFVDRNGAAYTPSTLSYRIDDLTNSVPIVSPTSLSPSGSTYELAISGTVNAMSNTFKTSQVNQVTVTATDSSGNTYVNLLPYELIAIAQVS